MTSQQRRGLANDQAEVGLDDSTPSWLMASTWGSVQRSGDSYRPRPSDPQRLVTIQYTETGLAGCKLRAMYS